MAKTYSFVTAMRNEDWDKFGRTFVQAFRKFCPKEVKLFLQFSSDKDHERISSEAKQLSFDQNTMWAFDHTEEEKVTIKKIIEGKKKKDDFFNEVVRYMILNKVSTASNTEYLCWLAPDIIFDREFNVERLSDLTPSTKEISKEHDTFFMVFKNSKKGKALMVKKLKSLLNNEKIKYPNRDWEKSPLVGYSHLHEQQPDFNIPVEAPKRPLASNINIQTKNCVDTKIIQDNVRYNLKHIKKWIEILRPNNEEIVFCSAGPSLKPEIPKIREFYEKGYKIIAVKHAMKTLLAEGIIPWGCILLDPRQHVADFVQFYHKDVKYFVSSMADPEVVRKLKEKKAQIWGYHALVGAGENKIIPPGNILISGGSGSATRGLSVIVALGFKTFHLFGYDCGYLQKPDMNKMKPGTKEPMYWELDLDVTTHGGHIIKKTIYTEAELFAQIKEFQNIYLPNAALKFITYGDGIIPFINKHYEYFQAWNTEQNKKRDAESYKALDVNAFFSQR